MVQKRHKYEGQFDHMMWGHICLKAKAKEGSTEVEKRQKNVKRDESSLLTSGIP